jgi:hypothetical protein
MVRRFLVQHTGFFSEGGMSRIRLFGDSSAGNKEVL